MRHVLFRIGAGFVDAQIRALIFFFFAQAYPDPFLERTINGEAADQGDGDTAERAEYLSQQRDSAHASERLQAEDAAGDAAPGTGQAV